MIRNHDLVNSSVHILDIEVMTAIDIDAVRFHLPVLHKKKSPGGRLDL